MTSMHGGIRPSIGLLVLLFFILLALICSEMARGHEADSRLAFRYMGSLFLLAAIALVSLACGLAFLGRDRPDVLSLSLALLLGYGCWGLLVFLTGVLHGLYRVVLAAELLCLGLVFRRTLGELPLVLRDGWDKFRNASRPVQMTMGAVGTYCLFLLVLSLGPVTAWDALESHWAIAKFFARHHAAVFPLFNGNGGTPQLMRMNFSAFCVFGFDHQASLVVWVLFVATMGLVLGVARRVSPSAGAQALTPAMFALLVLQPKFTTSPILDFPVLAFGLGAAVAAMTPALTMWRVGPSAALDRPCESRLLIASGVLTGFMLGTKWHSLPLLPVVLAGLFLFWWETTPRDARGRVLTLWSVLSLLPVFVFSVYDLVCTGHPFWHPMIPLLWDRDYWSPVSGNVLLLHEHMNVVRTEMYPSPLLEPVAALTYLLKSVVLVLPGLFCVPFAFLDRREPNRKAIGLLFWGGLLCVLGSAILVSADVRHTLPGVALLLLLVPVGWDSLMRRRFRFVVWALPALVAAGVAYKVSDRRLPIVDQYTSGFRSVVCGPYFDEAYRTTFALSATRWANAHLPAQALVVADARRLGNLDRDWMTIFPATQFVINLTPQMPADSLRAALQRIGTSHLWVDRHQDWRDTIGFPSLASHLAPWYGLIERKEWLETVYTDSLVLIHRLK